MPRHFGVFAISVMVFDIIFENSAIAVRPGRKATIFDNRGNSALAM